MESELTEYQKQKFRDLSVLITQIITEHVYPPINEITLIAKQAIPYSIVPLIATNYATAINPLKEEIFETWVETSTPTPIENITFYITVCLHNLYSEDPELAQKATEDWPILNDILLTQIDGEDWDNYLSDIDKIRELTQFLNPILIKEFFDLDTIDFNFVLTGEKPFPEGEKARLDSLHSVFDKAMQQFQVAALVELWFTTPAQVYNRTPLEEIWENPIVSELKLLKKLDSITEDYE